MKLQLEEQQVSRPTIPSLIMRCLNNLFIIKEERGRLLIFLLFWFSISGSWLHIPLLLRFSSSGRGLYIPLLLWFSSSGSGFYITLLLWFSSSGSGFISLYCFGLVVQEVGLYPFIVLV